MKKICIVSGPIFDPELVSQRTDDPLVVRFFDAYKGRPGARGRAYITSTSEKGKTSLLILRLFLEEPLETPAVQRYLVGIRFHNFGDVATIDLVSCNTDRNCEEIATEYCRSIGWAMFSSYDQGFVLTNRTCNISHWPVIFLSGRLKMDERISLLAEENHDQEVFSSGHDLASFVLSACGMPAELDDQSVNRGRIFVEDISASLLVNMSKNDFYEDLALDLAKIRPELLIDPDTPIALAIMKSLDECPLSHSNGDAVASTIQKNRVVLSKAATIVKAQILEQAQK